MPARGQIYIEAVPEPAVVAQAYFTTAEKLNHLEEPLRLAAGIAVNEIEENFAAQGRPDSWEPLSQTTIERRVWQSLSDSQQASLRELQRNAAFEGELVTDSSGIASFVPAGQSKYDMVLLGLASDMQILVNSGALKAGVTSEGNWVYRTLSFNSQAIEMTDPTGYGAYHITGNDNLPVRDWSYISEGGMDEMASVMADWLVEQ